MDRTREDRAVASAQENYREGQAAAVAPLAVRLAVEGPLEAPQDPGRRRQ